MSAHTQAHAIGSSDHTSGTLADLQTKISDLTIASTAFVTGQGYITSASVTYETLNSNGDIGSGAGTLCAGDDSRLSDPRTPVSHDNTYHSVTFVETTDSRLSDARTPVSHDNTYHSASYITATGVTKAALDATSSVGVLSTQVAQGNHGHLGVYDNTFTTSGGDDGRYGTSTNVARGDHYHHDLTAGTGLSMAAVYDGSVDRTMSVSYGTSAGTACEGNDSRLSDSRTPTSHTDHPGIHVTAGTLTNNQGSWITWNQQGGSGLFELICHRGTGTGGFAFYNTNDATSGTTVGSWYGGELNMYSADGTKTSQIITQNGGDGYFRGPSSVILEAQGASGTLYLRTNGAHRMSIDPSGNTLFANMSAGSDVQTDGSGYLVTTSDERLKNVHGVAPYGLYEVLQLTPRLFNYKTDPDDAQSIIGFVAQEVQPYIPECTNEGPNGYLGFNSRGIVCALVNATKELNYKIENQDKIISTQDKIISTQNEAIDFLEQEVNKLKQQIM